VTRLIVSAVKHTKETLAREPDNITVWAGHARLEIKRGRLEAARAVYAGVLAQQSDAFAGDNSPALAMWADWAMMEWANGDQARCSEVLVALAHSRLPGGDGYQNVTDVQKDCLGYPTDHKNPRHWLCSRLER
jgi:hypothetical protein